ncbi:hypothetical protein AB0P05_26665 [Streptomyces flaveolus]|uniref:hypothetical protein n=1 Tax=Streptomyces flaveolus TaxID=67297 RepID=UPI0034487509
MSDDHRGLPHDLPEYVPNWPVPIKVRAKVYKIPETGYWYWSHRCPRRGTGHVVALGYPQPTHAAAYAAALKHARGCW